MNQVTQIKISEREKACLKVLAEHFEHDANCMYMRFIAKETKLTLVQVRRSVRSLARKGLAAYERGLFDDDGKVAGSGYRATLEGAMMFNACIDCKDALADMVDGRCEKCWKLARDAKVI